MKERQSAYAFYGSLRIGMVNHEIYKAHLDYLFSCWLKGFKLFTRGDYPFAVRTETDESIIVEVFRINDPGIERAIHQMEMEEGYYLDQVHIRGYSVGIYLLRSPGVYPYVRGGDWVTFFRQNSDK